MKQTSSSRSAITKVSDLLSFLLFKTKLMLPRSQVLTQSSVSARSGIDGTPEKSVGNNKKFFYRGSYCKYLSKV